MIVTVYAGVDDNWDDFPEPELVRQWDIIHIWLDIGTYALWERENADPDESSAF